MNPKTVVVVILVLIVALVITIGSCAISSSYTATQERTEAAEAKRVAAAEYAATHPRVVAPAQRQSSFKTFDIPEDGLAVYLYPGWKNFAIGGPITITPPGGGRLLHDEPGANHDYGWQPEGIFIFRADPPGSKRQVEIYNKW